MSKIKTFSEIYNLEEFLEKFEYLTSKHRGERTTESQLIKHYREKTDLKLIKRLDPVLYNTMKNDGEI